jgi:hypothetical protein
MSERQHRQDSEKGITRGQFLKFLGVGAATVATAGISTGCEAVIKNEREEILAEMLNAPTEDMRVRPWGETPEEGEENDATTISELRENAGWEPEHDAEFEKVVGLKNPGSIDKNHTIQPGWYKVPVNKTEESK